MKKELLKAVRILRKGGVVVFPTDTAYGIGCRIDNQKAIERLFKMRKRPKTQAVPVLVDSMKMAQKYLQPLSAEVKNLMKKYWPGGLTIVYPCQTKKVPSLIRGGGKTLGVRMPDHQIALGLIQKLGVPIVGTSANFHGGKTPCEFEDLNPNLLKKVDFVINGECPKGQASTVIDCSKGQWQVLRQGVVDVTM